MKGIVIVIVPIAPEDHTAIIRQRTRFCKRAYSGQRRLAAPSSNFIGSKLAITRMCANLSNVALRPLTHSHFPSRRYINYPPVPLSLITSASLLTGIIDSANHNMYPAVAIIYGPGTKISLTSAHALTRVVDIKAGNAVIALDLSMLHLEEVESFAGDLVNNVQEAVERLREHGNDEASTSTLL